MIVNRNLFNRRLAHACTKNLKSAIASGKKQLYTPAKQFNFKEGFVMLSLRFSRDDYAFVFTDGRPIGAIVVGEIKGRSQLSLFFSGEEMDFEILRPQAVERRFGRDELEKLRSRFLCRGLMDHKPANRTICRTNG